MDDLIEKYPSLFAHTDKWSAATRAEPIGCYGIECDLGWKDILSSLCFMIDQHERNIKARDDYSWKEYGEPTREAYYYKPVKFTQIKEKFGGLTIYYDGGDDYVRGLVGMAECWSRKVCEMCGEMGKPTKGGWIKILCDKCLNKNKRLDALQKLSDLDQEMGLT